ncbi:MAG: hypothetical protein WA432_03120 [Candidatus Babeliaceae bacterium]
MRIRIFFLVCLVNYVSFLQGMQEMFDPESTHYKFVENLIKNNSSVAQFYHNEFHKKETFLWEKILQEFTPEQRTRFNIFFNNALDSLNKQPIGLVNLPDSKENISSEITEIARRAAKDFKVSIHSVCHGNHGPIKMSSFLHINNNFYHILTVDSLALETVSTHKKRVIIYLECAHVFSKNLARRAALMYAYNTKDYVTLLKKNIYLPKLHMLEEYRADASVGLLNLQSVPDIASFLSPYRHNISPFKDDGSSFSPPLALRYLRAIMLKDDLTLEQGILLKMKMEEKEQLEKHSLRFYQNLNAKSGGGLTAIREEY